MTIMPVFLQVPLGTQNQLFPGPPRAQVIDYQTWVSKKTPDSTDTPAQDMRPPAVNPQG